MSFLPLPDDTVIDIQNRVMDYWNHLARIRNYRSVAEFLIQFKKGSIEEFHVNGPNAYWFTIGLMVGSFHERQLIKTEIDALSERIADPFPEAKE